MSSLFGGSKSKQTSSSESYNKSYDDIRTVYNPAIARGNDAGSAIMKLLGLGGDSTAQQAAFQDFLGSSGYNFQMDQGRDVIEGSAAGRGLLNSGSTLRAMSDYGQQTGQAYFQKYLEQLMAQQAAGMQGAGLLANAGQYSKSNSTGTSSQGGGLGGFLGSALSLAAAIPTGGASLAAGLSGAGSGMAGMFSDPALKKDIVKIGEYEDGLGLYEFKYLWDEKVTTGVMADEVAELRPWALGPEVSGFKTVDYGRL